MAYSFSKHAFFPRPRSASNYNNNNNHTNRQLGPDFWGPLLKINSTKLQQATDALHQQYQNSRQNASTIINNSTPTRKTRPFDNNNNTENTTIESTLKRSSKSKSSSKKSKPHSTKSISIEENEERWITSPYPSVKVVSSAPPPSRPRASTAPPSPQQQPADSPTPLLPRKAPRSAPNTSPRRKKVAVDSAAPGQFFSFNNNPTTSTRESLNNNSAAAAGSLMMNENDMKDFQIVLPRRRKLSSKSKGIASSKRNNNNSVPGSDDDVGTNTVGESTSRVGGSKFEVDRPTIVNYKSSKTQSRLNSSPSSSTSSSRTQTSPLFQEQKNNTNFASTQISTKTDMVQGCLKRSNHCPLLRASSKKSDRTVAFDCPLLRPVKQGVTFAPGTLNVERESKPRKQLRMKNNRKPKFAHPCSGHFLPPIIEIIQVSEQDNNSSAPQNLYTKFNTIWCGPMGRVSRESVTKKAIRCKRFRTLLSSLSITHESFNTVPEEMKAHLMTEEILPRYISVLDIALMDGEMDHVEQLLTTVISSLTVLQINLHDVFFDKNGKPRPIREPDQNEEDYMADVGPIIFAMNRITSDEDKYPGNELPIESLLVKLQLELLVLCFCPFDCLIFRSQLAVIPTTAREALDLLRELRQRRTYYCVRWINDSVMHRDYMSLLKFFGFCDLTGAKNPVPLPPPSHEGPPQQHRLENAISNSSMSNDYNNNNNNRSSKKNNTNNNARRPTSADPVLMSNSVAHSYFSNSSSFQR